jgi:histidinol-phosphate aminotransferase
MTPFPREAYRPLVPYSPDRRPVPVDLSDNTSRWGPHPAALRLIREAEVDALTRYPGVYADALKAAVARRFAVPVECVATGCGSDDLMDSTIRAAGEPGEEVVFMPPTFSMIEIFGRMNGMTLRPVPVREAADPTVLLRNGPALVYVCRPNNPTGESHSREWVGRLLNAVGEDGPIVLLDEAYADFAAGDFLAEAISTSRLLILRTMSKVYGLAGLRVGFAIGSPEVVAEVEKSRGPYKVNRLAEAAAAAALDDSEGWIPEVLAKTKAERERLFGELLRRGLSPQPSQANFLLLPLPAERTAKEVTAALRDRGVAIRPFPDLPEIGETIRISVGRPDETDIFLEALDEALR